MKTMSKALEARIQIDQCRGTVVKLPKLSGDVGADQRLCLKCSAFNPNFGNREGEDAPYCLQAYADGSGSPVETLFQRIKRRLFR